MLQSRPAGALRFALAPPSVAGAFVRTRRAPMQEGDASGHGGTAGRPNNQSGAAGQSAVGGTGVKGQGSAGATAGGSPGGGASPPGGSSSAGSGGKGAGGAGSGGTSGGAGGGGPGGGGPGGSGPGGSGPGGSGPGGSGPGGSGPGGGRSVELRPLGAVPGAGVCGCEVSETCMIERVGDERTYYCFTAPDECGDTNSVLVCF